MIMINELEGQRPQLPAGLIKIKNMVDYLKSVATKGRDSLRRDKLHPVPHFWVAGGAVLSCVTGDKINDFDVFSPDPNYLCELLLLGGLDQVSFIKDYLTNFSDNYGNKIQVIQRYQPQDPEACFETFDFTVSCASYDGNTFCAHDRFFQDVATRRLVMNQIHWPLKTLERVAKYSRRGYTACPFGLLDLAKSINSLVVDWDNPDQNHLAFYPDGSPRFNGVD